MRTEVLNTSLDSKKNLKYLSHSYLKLSPIKKKQNQILFDHPWNSFLRFSEDEKKVNKNYQLVLTKLSLLLNRHFMIKKNRRYWEILIGPWVHCLIVAYFEKNLLVNKLIKLKKKIKVDTFKYKAQYLIPRDFLQFQKENMRAENWQNYLFTTLIESLKYKKNLIVNQRKAKGFYNIRKSNIKIKKKISFFFLIIKLKEIILIIFFNILNFFKFKKSSAVFFDTYLGLKKNIMLIIKNLAYPQNFSKIENFVNPDMHLRAKLVKKIKSKNMVDKIYQFCILNIPTNYLEDYHAIEKKLQKTKKNPSVILTNSGFYGNSLKTRYIAESVSNGAKLILNQHGGKAGHHKISFTDKYETRISDNYISWGWKNKKNKKIKNYGIIKNINKISRNLERKTFGDKILFLMCEKGRFTSYFDFEINSKCLYSYYSETCPGFYNNLNKNLKKKLIYRVSSRNNFWNELDYIKKNCTKARLSYQRDEYMKLIKKSKIAVCSYLATTFLELMTANVPVLLFVPFPQKIYNNETLKNFKIMKKNNIFFDNYINAAKFINNNWNRIDSWWLSKSVQQARLHFLKSFSRENKNLVNKIGNLINKNAA